MATANKIIGIFSQIEITNLSLPLTIVKDVYVLPPYIKISKLSSDLRQKLCNAVQMGKDAQNKHEILDQIDKSQVVIGISLPNDDIKLELFVPFVAGVILNRLSDIIRIFYPCHYLLCSW